MAEDPQTVAFPDDSRFESSEDAPLSVRLNPQGDLHGKILAHLEDMIQRGDDHIDQRSDDWERVDEHLRLYVNLDRTARSGDKGWVMGNSGYVKENPWQRMIVIPVSYATIMTRMVQMYAVFSQVDPFIHYEPSEGGDRKGARLHELAVGRDAELSQNAIETWQMLYDAERYGMACWYDSWEEKWGWAYQAPKFPPAMRDALPPAFQYLTEKSRDWKMLREWNNWRTIDPRCLCPDPNRAINDVQSMSWIGHWEIVNWLDLHQARLKNDEGPYFNVDAARKKAYTSRRNRRSAGRASEGDFNEDSTQKFPDVMVHHFQWKIIPRELHLGPETKPVKWNFSVAEESVIIRAHPSPYEHNDFTYSIGAPDPDKHAPFTQGMGGQLVGSQDLVNWLVNSHIANIRKTVNDQVIYNPNLVNEADILNPGPARHIRLTKRGRQIHERGIMPISNMYGQFQITDITQPHLAAAQGLIQQTQRMAATPDTVQGMPLPTKRTLGEIEHVSSSATMRIGTTAELLDRQIVKPVAERAIMNRQQFTSMELMVRITGRLAAQLGVKEDDLSTIYPDDLYGSYDYIARTPTMVRDPARSAALWGSLLQLLGNAPQLLMPDEQGRAIDAHKVLNEFIRVSGVNYFEDFYKEIQMPPAMGGGPPPVASIVPDGQVRAAADAGRLAPMPGGLLSATR